MLANVLRSQSKTLFSVCKEARSTLLAKNLASLHAQNLPRHAATRSFSRSSIFQQYSDDADTRFARRRYDNDRAPRFEKQSLPSPTLYLGNLPYNTSREEILEVFSQYGPVKDVRIGYDAHGEARGFAHVEFENQADAVHVFESSATEPVELSNRQLRVDYTQTRAQPPQNPPHHKLYFLNFEGDETSLRGLFGMAANDITKVSFFRDRETGDFNGRGLVEFSNIPQATEALESFKQSSVEGQSLRVQYSRPANDRDSSRFGGQQERRRPGGFKNGGFKSGGFKRRERRFEQE